MLAPLNRLPRPSVALAVAVVVAGLWGCDTPANQSERQARTDVEKAEAALLTTDSLDQPIAFLESAAAVTDASPTTRMRASSLLAQLLARQARDAVWQIDRLDRDAQRLAMEVGQLAGQLQFASQLSAGYKLFDPTPVVNNLSKQADDARGGADRPIWFETDGMRFDTLNTVSNDLSRLEGEVAQLEQKIQGMQTQRDAAVTSAEEASRRAEASSGREAVDAFIQSSNMRKTASDLGTQIEGLTTDLNQLKRDVAILDARKGYVSNAARQLEEGGNSLQAGWASMQKAIASQNDLARSIASGTGGAILVEPPKGVRIAVESLPAGSIAEKSEKLTEIARQADSQRDEVLEKLNAASKYFADAVTSADAARSAFETAQGNHPSASEGQKKAWAAAKNVLSAATYRVEQADVLRLIAQVHASRAAAIDVRLQLQSLLTSAFQGSNINPPETMIDSQWQAQFEQALKEADEAFRAADELLDTVLQSGQNTEAEKAAGNSARVSRIFGLYRWAQVAADMGAADQAAAHMEMARSIVTEMVANGTPIPRLPTELAAVAEAAKPPEMAAPAGDPPAGPPVEGTDPPVEGTEPPVETPQEEGAPPEQPAEEPPAPQEPPASPPEEPG